MNNKVTYMQPYCSKVANFFKFTNLDEVLFGYLDILGCKIAIEGCLRFTLPYASALRKLDVTLSIKQYRMRG